MRLPAISIISESFNVGIIPRQLHLQWLDRLDVHGAIMHQISEPARRMLRRYLMIALATYNAGGTVCYQIAARKAGG
ncbi:MAG: hypothetical protein HY760_01925 [Nitrospirae bacterium]|nr:hypothetical protein [Nitrospirota bacterium]